MSSESFMCRGILGGGRLSGKPKGGVMLIRDVRELEVWNNAMDVAMLIFHRSKRFPIEERFSVTDQIRRSSRSVATNITRGLAETAIPGFIVSKLNDSEAEAAET